MSSAIFDLSNIMLEEHFYSAFAEINPNTYNTDLKSATPPVEEYDLDGIDVIDEEEDFLP